VHELAQATDPLDSADAAERLIALSRRLMGPSISSQSLAPGSDVR
jgi:hypothetical protein